MMLPCPGGKYDQAGGDLYTDNRLTAVAFATAQKLLTGVSVSDTEVTDRQEVTITMTVYQEVVEKAAQGQEI